MEQKETKVQDLGKLTSGEVILAVTLGLCENPDASGNVANA